MSAFPIEIHMTDDRSWKIDEEFTSGLENQIAN
jgi:hypothetical protein